jgi:hypothetical protein
MHAANGNLLWVRPLLAELHLLNHRGWPRPPGELWQELSQSDLLQRLEPLPSLINEQAGQPLVDAQWMLPPQEVVFSFAVVRNDTEFVMRLVLDQAGPLLVFFSKKVESSYPHSAFYHYFMRDDSIHVKLRYVIHPAQVTDQDLQEWFSYLLSGFQKSFQPTHH